MTANRWERLRLAASCILQSYDAEQPDLAWHVKMGELRHALGGLMQLADLPAAAPEPVVDAEREAAIEAWKSRAAIAEWRAEAESQPLSEKRWYAVSMGQIDEAVALMRSAPKPAEPAPPASDWRERFLVYLARCEDGIDRDGPKMLKALFDGLAALEANVARLAKKVGG